MDWIKLDDLSAAALRELKPMEVQVDIGMLWFDNDSKTELSSKVVRAADYFRKKYGQDPNQCFVHPSMISGEHVTAGKVSVCSNQAIIPNHFWIGVTSAPPTAG